MDVQESVVIAIAVPAAASEAAGPAPSRGAQELLRITGVDVLTLLQRHQDLWSEGRYPTARLTVGDRCIIAVRLHPATDRQSLFEAALATSALDPRVAWSLIALEAGPQVADPEGAVALGHLLGGWRYAGPAPIVPTVQSVRGLGSPTSSTQLRAEAVAWVRSVVEQPPNQLGPAEFAAAIDEFADRVAPQVAVEVVNSDHLKAAGFHATAAVGAGSARSPLVVHLRYGDDPHPLGLAGKGITFDAGGLDIKQDPVELSWMKSDMAAAASVAAAVITAAALGSQRPVHAVLPIAENLPGPGAARPGDVVGHPDGSTTEITDTDCEGRLVLADALAALRLAGAHSLIDVGTLTDGGGVGLERWGCWSNDEVLVEQVLAAGVAAADPGWRLPMSDFAARALDSRVADRANTTIRGDDTGQVAAAYLSDFVADLPWVHIDNGSNAYLEEDVSPWPAGPTGSPVLALIEFLCSAGTD